MRMPGAPRRAGLYLFGITLTTIVTTLATMPFTIYHFNRFALYSVVANALAVPITGFWVMPWAIVACLAMPLHLEALALVPMGWGIDAIVAIARMVTSWPGAVLAVPSLPAPALALLSFGGLWLCIWHEAMALARRWCRSWRAISAWRSSGRPICWSPPMRVSSPYARPTAPIFPRASRTRALSRMPGRSTRRPRWERPGPRTAAPALARCAAMPTACLYRARGQVVALIRDGTALAEECGAADLVVSPVAAHRVCRHTRVIDRNDTWRKGGYAVWLDPDRIRIATVRGWQGARPWVPKPPR